MNRIGHARNYWRGSKSEVDFRRMDASPAVVSFSAEPQHITMDLNKSAIIIVDMQNDFCTKGGWLDYIGANYEVLREPVAPLQRLLPELRAAEVPIIWLNWGNRPDRANIYPSVTHVYNPDGVSVGIGDPLPHNQSHVLEKGSWGAALIDELQTYVRPEDLHIDKYRMSGFIDTPLDSILRNLRVEHLFFAGVNIDQCVMATLQDAVNAGYDSILLEDCCATSSPVFCLEATLYNVKQCYGFVASSEDLVNAITSIKGSCAHE